MTDEQMDARLRTAGETWRATAGRAAAARELGPDATAVETLDTRRPHRPRRTGLLVSAAAVAAALVAGGAFLLGGGAGSHHQSAAAAGLEGTVWRLVGVGNQPEHAKSLATMYIDKDGNLVADDSCAVVGAHVDVRAGHLYPTGNFDVRDYDCTDSAGELTFGDGFGLLTSFPSYEVTGAGLVLSAPGQPALRFTAAVGLVPPTTDVPTFLGATWRLTNVTDGRQMVHPITGTPTLQVRNGQLTASDGCNTIDAAAAVTGQEVALKNVTTSAVGCIGSVSTTAAAIDAFFTGDGLHEQIDGTTLMVKGNGVGVLTYQWVPGDHQGTDPARLVGPTWRLASVAGEPAAQAIDLRIEPDDRLTTSDGCAGFSATAHVGHGTFTLTGVARSGGACAQAQTIDSFLNQKPARWAIRSGKLLIYGGGPQAFALVYDAAGPTPTTSSTAPTEHPLAVHPWKLVGVEMTSGGTSSGSGSSNFGITLTLDGFGAAKLDSGCSQYTAGYVLAAHTIAFTALIDRSTASCGSRPLTAQVVRALAGTVGWKIDKGQLIVTKGDTTLTFGP